MKPAIRVSAVIPVYNDERTIAAAVESALAQRFDGAFEVIVVNDGSTDGTRAVLSRFGDRIRVIDQNRGGVSAARNAGIAAAAGEYVALLDGDDSWTDDKLGKTVPLLERNASSVGVFSDAAILEIPGRNLLPNYVAPRFQHSPTLDEMLRPPSWPILPSATVIRRQTILQVGGFPEEFAATDYGYEDTFTFLLLRERGELVYVPLQLVRYRMPDWESKLTDRFGPISINGGHESDGRRTDPGSYFRGNRVFAQMLRERFGARGRELAAFATGGAARELTMLGMKAMHEGDRAYARRCYLSSIRYRPSELKTWFRLAWAALPASMTRMLSPMLTPELRRSLSGPPFLEQRAAAIAHSE